LKNQTAHPETTIFEFLLPFDPEKSTEEIGILKQSAEENQNSEAINRIVVKDISIPLQDQIGWL
jgi:hypothetical protein